MPGPAEGALPLPPAEGFAVLPWGTRVYVEPHVGGPSVQLGVTMSSPTPWPTGGTVVRVVGERDGLVEIAPLRGDELQYGRHCGTVLDSDAFDVRLYVSRWSPALVLARTHEQVDDEGHVSSLRPGAVVQRIAGDPEGAWAVSAGGLALRASLPDDAVGRSYRRPDPVSGSAWRVDDSVHPTFDGWPVAFDRMYGEVTIGAVEPDDEGYRVELLSPCARVTVSTAREPPPPPPEPHFEFGLGAPDLMLPTVPFVDGLALAPVPAVDAGPAHDETEPELEPPRFEFIGDDGIMGQLLPLPPQWVFEEGAPIYPSPAGPAVGTLAQLRVFHEDAWLAGDRICFRTSFGARFVPALPVCLDGVEGRLHDPQKDLHDGIPDLVRPESLILYGALDRPDVERAMRIHRHELRRCAYEGHSRSGRLVLTFVVRPSGQVSGVEVHTSTLLGHKDRCMERAAEAWVLPAPTNGKPASVRLSVEVGQFGSGGGSG